MPYFTISHVTDEAIYLKPIPNQEEAKKEERKYINSYVNKKKFLK